MRFVSCLQIFAISIGICIMSSATEKRPHIIIWDLNGVLLTTSRAGIGWEIMQQAPYSFITHALRHGKDKLQQDAFSMMDTLYPHKHTSCDTHDPEGNVLPALMHDWLAGLQGCDSYSNIKYLDDALQAHNVSTSTQNAYAALFHAIFDPRIRSNNTYVYAAGYDILHQIKQTHPDCTHMVLSNYDTACFSRLYHAPHTQQLFDEFAPHHVYISADMQMIKPDTQIYRKLCEQEKISPQECIFIDDQACNVEAARAVGMHVVHFDQSNPNAAYNEITRIITQE